MRFSKVPVEGIELLPYHLPEGFVSGSLAPTLELGKDRLFERIDGTINCGHPTGHVQNVAQIARLGV